VDVLRNIRARCVTSRPVDEPQPTVGDLFNIGAIRNACTQCSQDPSSSPVSALQFVSDDFLLFREHWIQRCRRTLLALIEEGEVARQTALVDDQKGQGNDASVALEPPVVEINTAPVDKLELATSFFGCFKCRSHHLRFPSILFHKCLRRGDVGGIRGKSSDWVADALSTGGKSAQYEGRWNFDDVYASCIAAPKEIQMANMLAVLKVLDLDPTTTTVDQLNDLDPIVECLSCSTLYRGRCVMDWTAVVSYLLHV